MYSKAFRFILLAALLLTTLACGLGGLTSQKEGRTNAEARLLLGDVALAEGDPASAAREYLVVGQIFSDPQITPTALSKAAAAFRQSGDDTKAAQLEAQIQGDYPDFKAAP